jgi:WD40 repeat protein
MPGIKRKSRRILDPHVRLQWSVEVDDHINSLAWSPDSKWVAAASVSGPVVILDGRTGQVRHRLAGHRFGTCEVAWNADGSRLASVGQDSTVRLWDPENGAHLHALAGGAAWVEHLAWSPIGNLLASAAGRKLRLWNGEGELVQAYPDQISTISDLQWKPGEQVLTSASYSNVTLWTPHQNEPLRNLHWKGSILALAWSANGRCIATGDQDATVHFWFAQTGQDLQMYGYPTKVRELSWDSSSRYLATGGSATATVWDCSGKKGPEGSKPLELHGHTTFLSALAFQPHGPLIVTADGEGRVLFWRIDRPRQPLMQMVLGSGVSQVAWAPTDDVVAFGTETGQVSAYTSPRVSLR